MFENDFLSDLTELQEGVNSGVIVAYANWTKFSGICKFKDFNVFEKNGNRSFQLLLENEEGMAKFFLRIPATSDKNGSKAHAWEDIFKVLFGAANMEKNSPIKEVYAVLDDTMNKREFIICDYVAVKEVFTNSSGMLKEAIKIKSLKFKGLSEQKREGVRPLSIQENNENFGDVPF